MCLSRGKGKTELILTLQFVLAPLRIHGLKLESGSCLGVEKQYVCVYVKFLGSQTPTLSTWQAVKWNIPWVSLSFSPSSHLWSWGFPSGQSRGCCLCRNGKGSTGTKSLSKDFKKGGWIELKRETLLSENLSGWRSWWRSAGPAHMLSHHHRAQMDPTVGKGEWKQICHSVCCLYRSMCKNSPLPTICYTQTFLWKTHTPVHSTPLTGSLLGSLVSLGRVKGVVCF